MTAEEMHMTERRGNAAIAHHDRDLMKGFGEQRPKIPIVLSGASPRARIAFDGSIEIGEFMSVANKKNGRIVADQIPIALGCIKFRRDSSNIAFAIGGAAFARHRRKSSEGFGHGAGLKNFCLGVSRDVVRDGQLAVRAPTFSVHSTLGDDFAVEMRHLLEQPHVLHCNAKVIE